MQYRNFYGLTLLREESEMLSEKPFTKENLDGYLKELVLLEFQEAYVNVLTEDNLENILAAAKARRKGIL